LIGGEAADGESRAVTDPADHGRQVGTVIEASEAQCDQAMAIAADAQPRWDAVSPAERAACLDRLADGLEHARGHFMALAAREAGKGLNDGIAEVREAADFCRYYAARARSQFSEALELSGPTGEHNQLELHGRGVFVCISPWNFPLAIFTGQVAAALVAGNSVIAKPAEQTPLMASAAVQAFHEAGIPEDVLHLLPGRGETVGARLLGSPHLSGAAFTGGMDTAHTINRQLAERAGPIVPLIAETGGQNAMLVDSSALPEQVVTDVIESAFRSAGQRCSALRVLFLQTDVADRILEMLAGAMAELRVGDPARLDTDVGPVIDATAQAMLEEHATRMEREGRVIARTPLGEADEGGNFFAPRAYEIERLDQLEGEIFGPILHVIRYRADALDDVLNQINATGYGLTLGIHSRIEETIAHIHRRLRVGNTYVNRNQVGSVVGVQPFGGEGLSGTGPKAGGPHNLQRFATERTLTINTTAQGGNAELLSLDELDMEERTQAPQLGLL
jgi:RHH-type proline utilization regulon transcriptional repressor/proline dehydrogenase/delta 1-pyrroline-5-carboxylate dehydrogenase